MTKFRQLANDCLRYRAKEFFQAKEAPGDSCRKELAIFQGVRY